MDNISIKRKISFVGIVRPFPMGSSGLSPVTLLITNETIIVKLFGLIKVREIPLKNIKCFKHVKKERVYLTYFLNAVKITYELNNKPLQDFIVATEKQLQHFQNELRSLNIRDEKSMSVGEVEKINATDTPTSRSPNKIGLLIGIICGLIAIVAFIFAIVAFLK